MTVKELIEALSKFDPNLPVVVSGYEGGFNDVSEVNIKTTQLNVNTEWYYGAHHPAESEFLPDVPMTDVVYLRGYNHLAEEPWRR